jgi:hypothetical protein
MTEVVRALDTTPPAEPSAGINFALVLSRTLDTVRENPAELRAVVYELARVKLKDQFGHEDAEEIKRLTAALEEAIQGVESFSQEETSRQLRLAAAPREGDHETMVAIGGPEPKAVMTAAHPQNNAYEWPSRQSSSERAGAPRAFGSIGRLGVVLIVAAAIATGIALWPQLRRLPINLASAERPASTSAPVRATKTTAAAPKPEEAPPAVPPLPFPLPTRFGVYAISDGRLQELKALPGKIPDSRVAVSAAINAPSSTSFADTRPKFIVFRRDGAVSAPDRVELRLVARVTRAMGVDGGKAKMTSEQDAWVVRNIAIPYGVGPVDEQHPDMYLIQAEAPDAELPPGRYALVLKGQGFDFAIDGAVTDPRHCMERIDAVNGAFYSPCPQSDKPR